MRPYVERELLKQRKGDFIHADEWVTFKWASQLVLDYVGGKLTPADRADDELTDLCLFNAGFYHWRFFWLLTMGYTDALVTNDVSEVASGSG